MAAKRLHGNPDEDPEQPDDKRVRRLPSFSTVIREAMMMKSVQSLLVALEPLLRRVMQEEIEAGLNRSARYIERAPARQQLEAPEPSAWMLVFRTLPNLPIFTGSKIEDADGNPPQLLIVDVSTGARPASPLPPSLRVELVPLFGDFPPDDREDWTADEFQKGVVKERAGKRPLLTGDTGVTMRDDCVTINDLQFTDNSSWIRSRKFRIGARIVPGSYQGPRIREAMTEPFVVRDHRGELYKKHYPPLLGDEVWRLEKIGKEGAFHRKLETNSIRTVQDFLRLLVVNPEQLRAIMGDGMTDRMWEATTNHAKKCPPGDKLYTFSVPSCTIFLDSICRIKKIVIDNVEYDRMQQLNRLQRDLVQQALVLAYNQANNLMEVDAVMLNANSNIALMQNEPVVQPMPAEAPMWYSENQQMGFQVDDMNQSTIGFQWNGHMFNLQ